MFVTNWRQQLPTKLVHYEPSSVALQTRLIVQHHSLIRFRRETSNKFSAIGPLSSRRLSFSTDAGSKASSHRGAQLQLHQRQLRRTGRSNGRMVSALTHDSHRVCGYALGSSKSLTLTAFTRLFGSGLPHTSVSRLISYWFCTPKITKIG